MISHNAAIHYCDEIAAAGQILSSLIGQVEGNIHQGKYQLVHSLVSRIHDLTKEIDKKCVEIEKNVNCHLDEEADLDV